MSKEHRIELKAVNSSGKQILCIQNGEIEGQEEFYFTLCGEYRNEKDFQIDFDCLSRKEFEMIVYKMLDMLKK